MVVNKYFTEKKKQKLIGKNVVYLKIKVIIYCRPPVRPMFSGFYVDLCLYFVKTNTKTNAIKLVACRKI